MLETMVLLVVGLAMGMGVAARRDRRHLARETTDMRAELATELERARRYGHGFHLVRIRLPEAAPPNGLDGVDAVRRTDRVWRDGADLLVLLPEGGDEALEGWRQRLVQELGRQDVTICSACFPRDGLTLDALLAQLENPPLSQRPLSATATRIQDRAAS